ncbi:unnamed protein product [Parajaminaea phylloscopi]
MVEEAQPQQVLVLCGLVGSGKSTFAKALCSHDTSYVRACQDVLGSRPAVESFVLRSLQEGKNVVVDRTNVDPSQRATWLRLALQHQERSPTRAPVRVDALVFETPVAECEVRLRQRTDHETLHHPDQALRVLYSFARELQPPTLSEGFHTVTAVQSHQMPRKPTQDDTHRILRCIADTPTTLSRTQGPLLPSAARPRPRQGQRGGGRGSTRSSWRGGQHSRGHWGGAGRGQAAWTGAREFGGQPLVRPPPPPLTSPFNQQPPASAMEGNRLPQP